MEGLARLLPLLLASGQQEAQLVALTQQVLLALLRQAVERIARMREAAAACLQKLLPAAVSAGVPLAAELAAAVASLSGPAILIIGETAALADVGAAGLGTIPVLATEAAR